MKPANFNRYLSVSLGTLLLASCLFDSSGPPDPVTSVLVTPDSYTLNALGLSTKLTVVVTGASGDRLLDRRVSWKSADARIATVDTSGTVTAVSNGTVTITAQADNVLGEARLTVRQEVAAIELTGTQDTLYALADTTRMSAVTLDSENNPIADEPIQWKTSNPAVAEVDSAGLVTAVANGVAVIAAEAGDTNASSMMAVAQAVATVEVNPPFDTLTAIGSTLQLLAEARDANGNGISDVPFLWMSSNHNVVLVDTEGLVSAVGEGTTTVTAAARGVPGSATIEVALADPSAITIASGDNQIAPAGTAVPVAPTVVVRDAGENPVPDFTVQFRVLSGGGSVTDAAPVTGGDGRATVGSWTLGTTPGTNLLEASVTVPGDVAAGFLALTSANETKNSADAAPLASQTFTVTFSATGVPGPAARLQSVDGDDQSGTVGTTLPQALAVRASDIHDNAVGDATVEWEVVHGAGTPSATTTQTDATGEARVGYTLGMTAGTDTVEARIPGGESVRFTLHGTAEAVAGISVVSGNNQQYSAGAPLPQPLVVLVADENGNGISGITVTWHLVAGTGTLGADTSVTDEAGRATMDYRLGTVLGVETIRARAQDAGSVDFNVTVLELQAAAGSLSVLILQTPYQTLTADSAIAEVFVGDTVHWTLILRDSLGNQLTRGGHSIQACICWAGAGQYVNDSLPWWASSEFEYLFNPDPDSYFFDNGDGTYSVDWVAMATGTNARTPAPWWETSAVWPYSAVRVVPRIAAYAAMSQMTASRDTLTVGDSALITVRLRDQFGSDLTQGGNSVRLRTAASTFSGQLGFTGSPGYSLGADAGDGTYTVYVKATAAGYQPIRVWAWVDSDSVAIPDTLAFVVTGDDWVPPFTPAAAESLIAVSYETWFSGTQHGYPSMALSTAADELTVSWGNWGIRQLSSEPRVEWPNTSSFNYGGMITEPWRKMYLALSAVHDGLRAINEGYEIGGPGGPDNPRAWAFGKFVQGLAHGWLALQFDSAFVFDETVDVETTQLALQHYSSVWAVAKSQLEEAITTANSNNFVLPATWINGNPLSNVELARLAHSYMARMMTQLARTPAERGALAWSEVIAHVDQGITQDLNVAGEAAGGTWFDYMKFYGSQTNNNTWGRADYKTIGATDTSGAYAAWLAAPLEERTDVVLQVTDQRISPSGDPTGIGTDFLYMGPSAFPAARGTYHYSMYGHRRYEGYYLAGGTAPITHMTVSEMQLIRAEALYRLGDLAGATDLINSTRVARGGLPPATAADADLFDKLVYEKRIETFLLCSGCAYFDRRGFGPLAPTGPNHHLGPVEGTPLHFPVPASELLALGKPVYSYGGVGNEGGAASPGAPVAAAPAAGWGGSVPAEHIYRFTREMTASEKLAFIREQLRASALSIRQQH